LRAPGSAHRDIPPRAGSDHDRPCATAMPGVGRTRRCAPVSSKTSRGWYIARRLRPARARPPTRPIRTSRSIAGSAFSLRSRASSARSSSSSAALPSPRRRLSALTPVAQRALVDAQIAGHLRDRLTGRPDQPHRALPEVPIELPARLPSETPPFKRISPRWEGKPTCPCIWMMPVAVGQPVVLPADGRVARALGLRRQPC
jgi:hypothetical protein